MDSFQRPGRGGRHKGLVRRQKLQARSQKAVAGARSAEPRSLNLEPWRAWRSNYGFREDPGTDVDTTTKVTENADWVKPGVWARALSNTVRSMVQC